MANEEPQPIDYGPASPPGTDLGRVPVLDSAGQYWTIDKSELPAAYSKGWTLATPEDTKKQILHEDYGEGLNAQLKALGEGTANTLPFGVGASIKTILGDTPEAEKARAEAFPETKALGTALGIAGQVATGMGPLALISKARAAVEGAGLASSLVSNPTIQMFANKAIGSFTEGALYKAGELVNDKLFGDPDLTVQRAFSQIGMSGLISGVVGPAAFGLARRVSPEASKAFASKATSQLSDDATIFIKPLQDLGEIPPGFTSQTANEAAEIAKNPRLMDYIFHPYRSAMTMAGNAMGMPNLSPEQLMEKGKDFLAEKVSAYAALRPYEDLMKKAISQTKSKVADIFAEVAPQLAAAMPLKSQEDLFSDRQQTLNDLSQDPQRLQDLLYKNTAYLYPHGSNIANSLTTTTANAISHLNNALPRPPPGLAPMQKWQPTIQDMRNFNQTWDALDKPLSLLDHVKTGTLSPVAVTAVRAIMPKLYQDMAMEMVPHLGKNARNIPYQTRMGLSTFLGSDLDGSLNPLAGVANQRVFAGPSRQPDGAVKPSQTGLGKLTISERMATPFGQGDKRE